MARGGKTSGADGARTRSQRVRTARGRRVSSTRWLHRQLNDPYVQSARREGYRSRSAYKLVQIDERFALLAPGRRVIDLGAAPGGWTQVIVDRVRPKETGGAVFAVDLRGMEPLSGAEFLLGDIEDAAAAARLRAAVGAPVDLVLSDMAAPATGHASTDHLRTLALAEAAFLFACEALAPGGAFVAKVFQGADEPALFDSLRRRFGSARRFKPKASRGDSAEMFLVARGFGETG